MATRRKLLLLSLVFVTIIYIAVVTWEVERTPLYSSFKSVFKLTLHNILPWDKAPACKPIDNVCFIKTRKTGSTTLSSVLNRYAITRNLSIGLLKTSAISGHFNVMPIREDSPKKLFLPPRNVKPGDWEKYKYNMMTVHVRYNRSSFETFMNPGTKYISILREPCSHFESDFVFYKLPSLVMGVKPELRFADTLEEYLRAPKFYWERTRKKLGQTMAKFTRNVQIFDLGLDHAYHNDTGVVQDYIKKLQYEFDLILLVDYFDESMLLLKKLLCWDWQDVLYVSRNMRPKDTDQRANLSTSMCNKIHSWNNADFLLYQTFNRTFWKRVAEYGPSFERDLAELKERRIEQTDRCVSNSSTRKLSGRYEVIYNTNSSMVDICKLFIQYNNDLIGMLRRQQSSGFHTDVILGLNHSVCGFEFQESCGFKNNSPIGYKWSYNSHKTKVNDVTTGTLFGTFMVATSSVKSTNQTGKNTASLTIPNIVNGDVCVGFHYYMTNASSSRKSTLQVCLKNARKSRSPCEVKWRNSKDPGAYGKWNHVSLPIKHVDSSKVVFQAETNVKTPIAVKGKEGDFDFALDDVVVLRDSLCHVNSEPQT